MERVLLITIAGIILSFLFSSVQGILFIVFIEQRIKSPVVHEIVMVIMSCVAGIVAGLLLLSWF